MDSTTNTNEIIQPYTDFASFLHNPWGYPTEEEKAAILVFKRNGRFIEGYNINNEISNLIKKYFGNLTDLHNNGLNYYYNELKNDVISNNKIGLILYGTDINNVSDFNSINNYTTINNTSIELTISGICQYLITEYIKKENVEDLCRKTPNFNIYYNPN